MFGKNITQEDVDSLKEEHEAVLLSLNNSKVLLAEKETEAKQKQSEVDDLILKIDESKSELLSLQTAGESEKNRLARLLAELQLEASEKQKELDELAHSIGVEKQAHKNFLVQVEANKEQREAEFAAEIQEQKKVLRSLSLLKGSLDKDISVAKANLEALTKKIFDKETYLISIEQQSVSIEQRIREDAEKSIQRVAEAESKVTALTEQAGDLSAQLVSLTDEISDLQKAKKIAGQELDVILEKNKAESANAEQLKKRHLHVVQKEEYLRDKYELIGETYPEFKI